jgi:hypothetical protein
MKAPSRRAVTVAVALTAIAVATLAVGPVLPASARNSPANVKALANSINRAKHLTYQAQYTSVSNGQTNSVTIAQAPPKSNFSTSSGSVINTGTATYYCSSGTSSVSGNSGKGSVSCVSSTGSNPLLALQDIFSSSSALNILGQASQSIVARALGIKVSSSTATFAGQPSTCVTVSVRGKSAKYCVTKQGILSYSGSPSAGYFELTSYSAKPSPTLFTLPPGATTQTLPTLPGSSVSIP